MYPDLPIEQLLRRNDTRFQLGFATEAKELVPDREEFLLSPSRRGLHVLAKNEEALATPVEVLRDIYGPKLEVEPPRVRLLEGVQVQEPIMQVRISLQTRYRPVVMQALEKRGANRTEEYVRSTYCVLRYQAPLAGLLGLPVELASLTEGSARHWIALSHYALVTGDPGGSAA
jgi:predicted membrane GTPase involved in stress response